MQDGEPAVPTTRHLSAHLAHHRGKSGSSVGSFTSAVGNVGDDTWEATSHRDREPSSRHHSPASFSTPVMRDDISLRSSGHHASDSQNTLPHVIGRPESPRPSAIRSPHLPKGEPIVSHKGAFTAPCSFRQVCEAIRDTAFQTNDLPIVVSLQVQCGLEQQEVMVKIMKEVWRDMLVQEAIQHCDPRLRVPNLEDLRQKILIKVRRPAELAVDETRTNQLLQMTDAAVVGLDIDLEKLTREQLKVPCAPAERPRMPEKVSKAKICESLSSLAVYTRSEPFRGFDNKEAQQPGHILSVVEGRILELNTRSPRDLFHHNKRFFMRLYPALSRVDSSNPDPSQFWRVGVQMVAMNWQKLDKGMMLNDGMFADENGWVLKPPGYQSSDEVCATHQQAAPIRVLDLRMTVFAAQRIPSEHDSREGAIPNSKTLRTTIEVELHAERAESAPKFSQVPNGAYKQVTRNGKTNHPSWGRDGDALRFNSVRVVEELSFIR